MITFGEKIIQIMNDFLAIKHFNAIKTNFRKALIEMTIKKSLKSKDFKEFLLKMS